MTARKRRHQGQLSRQRGEPASEMPLCGLRVAVAVIGVARDDGPGRYRNMSPVRRIRSGMLQPR